MQIYEIKQFNEHILSDVYKESDNNGQRLPFD